MSRFPKRGVVGLVLALMIAAGAIVAPYLPLESPGEVHLDARFARPGGRFLCGADSLGRDILARSLFGARVSLLVGLVTASVTLLSGLLIGSSAGLFGGLYDRVAMRTVDILLAFPGILLAIALVAVLGPSLLHAVLGLCLIGWVGYARLARSMALRLRQSAFVEAARSMGAGRLRILLRHVIPNLLGPMLVEACLGVGGAILSESGLSFLGLSVQPPAASFGVMLNEGRIYLDAPHLMVLPGSLLLATVLAFNLIGDGLRDLLDPRGKGR